MAPTSISAIQVAYAQWREANDVAHGLYTADMQGT